MGAEERIKRSFWGLLPQFADSRRRERAKTIAFPAISTGIYGYPLHEAAQVSSQAIQQFLSSNTLLQEIRLVFFSPSDAETFLKNHAFTE